MIGLNKIGLNQVQLNRLRLNAPFPAYGKMAGGGGSGDGFPQLPGDVTRWHFGGLTNEMMAAMDDPRIEDADHKGRFLSFKNFAWKGMSGVGGYGDENHQTFYKFTLNDYVFVASPPGAKHMNFTFRVTGLQPGNKLTLAFFGTTVTIYGTWNKDGIYTVDADIVETGKPTYFYNGYGATRGEFTIEILPLYPGALVFDGVDDYGTCDNFPILTKEKGYTVVALRQRISTGEGIRGLVSNVKNWFKDGAFILEYSYTKNSYFNRPVSFGAIGGEKDLPHILTYQTSKSYNGVSIAVGSFIGTDQLYVGKIDNIIGNCTNAAIWELVFLDHDATEEELTKIKDYFVKTYPWLFPDQAWTVTGKTNEDEDRATIANITGNGNDLVLSNFGFAEGSGYGLYKTPFELYPSVQHSSKYSLSFSKFALGDHNLIIAPKQNDLSYDIKVKVTGLKDGVKFKWGWIGTIGYIDITTDGIHMLNKPASQIRQLIVEFAEDFDPDHVVTIEQIPEYEGYLITDGVDDKIVSSVFGMGKDFTIVGEWKFIIDENKGCGLVRVNKLYIYNSTTGLVIYINSNSIKNTLSGIKGLNAVCSNGRIYDCNWNEISIKYGDMIDIGDIFAIAFSGKNFTQMAFKNLAIYPTVLSKDECIKAYNYLQTLKAK